MQEVPSDADKEKNRKIRESGISKSVQLKLTPLGFTSFIRETVKESIKECIRSFLALAYTPPMNSDFSYALSSPRLFDFLVTPAEPNALSSVSFNQNTSLQFADFAKESFDQLNRNCRYPTLMRNAWYLPENFEIVPSKGIGLDLLWHGDEQDPTLQINNFYTAIEHFFEEKKDDQDVYTIDCSVAQYLVMLRYIGKKHETCPDDISSNLLNNILMVQCSENQNINLSEISSLIFQFQQGQSQNVNIRHMTSRGYCGYFSNLKSYYLMSAGALSTQPSRMAHGLNVVSVGLDENNEMSYTGFSPLFRDGPKTYERIRDYLLHYLCEDDISDVSEFRLLAKKGIQNTMKLLITNNFLYYQFDEQQDTGTHGANVCFLFQ